MGPYLFGSIKSDSFAGIDERMIISPVVVYYNDHHYSLGIMVPRSYGITSLRWNVFECHQVGKSKSSALSIIINVEMITEYNFIYTGRYFIYIIHSSNNLMSYSSFSTNTHFIYIYTNDQTLKITPKNQIGKPAVCAVI